MPPSAASARPADEDVERARRGALVERIQLRGHRRPAAPERERAEPAQERGRRVRRRGPRARAGSRRPTRTRPDPRGEARPASREKPAGRALLRSGRRRAEELDQSLAREPAQPEDQERVAVELLAQQVVHGGDVLARVRPVRAGALGRELGAAGGEERRRPSPVNALSMSSGISPASSFAANSAFPRSASPTLRQSARGEGRHADRDLVGLRPRALHARPDRCPPRSRCPGPGRAARRSGRGSGGRRARAAPAREPAPRPPALPERAARANAP